MDRGSEFLSEHRTAHMAREIEYRRGSVAITLDATPGRSVFDQQNSDGMLTRSESRDYLLRSKDLVLSGARVEPEDGDLLIDVDANGDRMSFEVRAPASGEPPFRYSDPFRRTIRVHTKLVEVSP